MAAPFTYPVVPTLPHFNIVYDVEDGLITTGVVIAVDVDVPELLNATIFTDVYVVFCLRGTDT
jgi:hypothetical protein